MTSRKRLIKSLFSGITLGTMLFGYMSAVLPANIAKATSNTADHLIINEINWGGNVNQQWIELYNPTDTPITDTYRIEYTDDSLTQVVGTVSGSTIPANGYYLIGNNADLKISTDTGFDPSLTAGLPKTGKQYRLMNLTSDVTTPIDVAGSNEDTTKPLTGSESTSNASGYGSYIASMSRLDAAIDGTKTSSWFSSRSIGINYLNDVEEYGTPNNSTSSQGNASINRDIPAPTLGLISPQSKTSTDIPIIEGIFANMHAPANRAIVSIVDKNNGTVTQSSILDIAELADPSLSGFDYDLKLGTPLPVGTYNININGLDVIGNKSATYNVEIGTEKLDYTIIHSGLSIDAYPSITNQGMITITGEATSGTHAIIVKQEGALLFTRDLVTGPSIQAGTVPNTKFNFDINLIEGNNNFSITGLAGVNNYTNPINFSITKDTIAPLGLNSDKVKVIVNNPGTEDQIEGLAGASSEANIHVIAFADQAHTKQISSSDVNTDGSFKLNIGDNKYARVYLVLQDLAGNNSPELVLDNPISFINSSIEITSTVSPIDHNSATIKWTGVTGAVKYYLKYGPINNGFYSPILVCPDATVCSFETRITGLNADTLYQYAIYAIDQNGNQSNVIVKTFRTALTPAPVNTPKEIAPILIADNTNTTTTTLPSPTPVVSATPVATSTPEAGDVKSTTDDSTSRNWTPWIILGVLVLLALLATTGYFYWFGGEAGDLAFTDIENSEKKNGPKSVPAVSSTEDKGKVIYSADKSTANKTNKNKDKRW